MVKRYRWGNEDETDLRERIIIATEDVTVESRFTLQMKEQELEMARRELKEIQKRIEELETEIKNIKLALKIPIKERR